MAPMIRVQGLAKAFATARGEVRAVRGIDLEVAEGEVVVLLGPSGCGKTTTLRCIAGLERADAGTIEVAGGVVDGPDRFVPPERRDVGMVFQSYAVWPHLNVFENVALPLREGRRRAPGSEVRARALEALRLVRLEGLETRPVTDLSGGQQQRVALARAIVTRPRVLLMDEPLSNLDARLRDEMRTELKRLALQLGLTTLYVTHDQVEALSLGDRVCVMRDGAILQQGEPEELYARPADAFVAKFVGDVNLVPGVRRGRGLVETGLGVVRCDVDGEGSAGERVLLAMRPEHIELASEAGEGTVEGTLLARLFIGDAAVWQVRVGEITLLAKVHAGPRVAPGGAVRLRLPSSCWLVFRASDE